MIKNSMQGYIYKTTNLINNKIYIGKHSCKYFSPSYLGRGKYIKAAVSQYGKESFSVELIEWCDTIDALNDKERYWIKYYHDQGYEMYNIAAGGDGGDITLYMSMSDKENIKSKLRDHGYFAMRTSEQATEELKRAWVTRKRLGHINSNTKLMSARAKQYYASDKYKIKREHQQQVRKELQNKHNQEFITVWLTEKHLCKTCGKVMTEYYGSGVYCSRSCASTHLHSLETKNKLSEMNRLGICGNKGKKFSQEHKDKISAAHKGRIFTEEHRQHISEAKKGKPPWNKKSTSNNLDMPPPSC